MALTNKELEGIKLFVQEVGVNARSLKLKDNVSVRIHCADNRKQARAMEGCKHFWVERTDGYEEQCGAAICLICGEYDCECKVRKELYWKSEAYKVRRMELFKTLGIAGNKHDIEKRIEKGGE
ncbi:MAG: hypothetical protein JXD22_11610 [Sedimentisphaerales bacterium]|nr:hypothetical protein [Sedimentisphaerales bacterium]